VLFRLETKGNRSAGGVRLIRIQSPADRHEPNPIACERRQLLVQVQHGTAKAVQFVDSDAV